MPTPPYYIADPRTGANLVVRILKNGVEADVPINMSNADYAALIASGVTIQPAVLDIEGYLKQARDRCMNTQVMTVGGVQSTNNARTRAALREQMDFLLMVNDGRTIQWKGDNGFSAQDLAGLQAISMALGERTQKCFDAEALTLATHATTPFTTFAAVQAAFDSHM